MHKRNLRRLAGITAALAIAVSACGGSTPSAAAPSAAAPTAAAPSAAAPSGGVATAAPGSIELKIGIEGPFSGPNARTGEELKDGSTMAWDAVNWTVGPYKVVPVYIDDQSDPAKGASAYEQAVVGQGIVAGVLGWHSSVAVAQMEVAAKYKIPHFFAMGQTDVIDQKFNSDRAKYGYWVAKGYPQAQKLTQIYVNALEDAIKAGTYTPAEKKVALYAEDTDYGRSWISGADAQFKAAGWTIVSSDFFPGTQTDFSALMSRYKAENVPVLAGSSTIPASISAFIKQADDAGLKSMIIADGLGWIGDWYKLSGSSSDYVLDQIPVWASPAAKQYAIDFKAKFGFDPSPTASGLSFDETNYFIKVMKTTLAEQGEITSATLYKTAQDQIWTGKLTYTDGIIMPSYGFSAESLPDPIVGKGNFLFPVLQYHGGEGTIVWPPEWTTGVIQGRP